MRYKPDSEFAIELPADQAQRLAETIRHNERFMLVAGFVLGLIGGVAGVLTVVLL